VKDSVLTLRNRWLHIDPYIPTDKRIGVVVSGGWDSACLWYMTKTICNKRGQECIAYTVPKLDGAEHYANLVLKELADYMEIEFVPTRIVGNINSENPSDYVTSGVMEILENGYSEFLMVGMNKYPPRQREMLPEGYPMPNERYEVNEHDKQYVSHPFADWTKDETIQLGFDLGIEEIIMPITHSCTEQNRGRCNECWWCAERAWGFKEINKIDKGKE
jgi:7-cyano-7-deazaguanine synthase in queuosine biosynthesis